VQPIRTLGGYPMNSGTPARLYVNSDYSIQVQNRNGSLIYSAPAATDRFSDVVVQDISSTEVTFLQAGSGAVTRTAQAKMRDIVSVKDFGAVGDGVTSDSLAFQNAMQSGAKSVYVPPGNYAIGASFTVTLPNDVELTGEGTLIYTGASSTANLFVVQCAGYSFAIRGLTLNGSNLIAGGPRIDNANAMSINTLPSCYLDGNTIIDFRMNTASIWNDGALIRGSFERVVIRNNNVRNITRAAGTGTPGSSGTSGITVTQYDATKWVRECIHSGNAYTNITGGDLLASANNVDYDGFRFFSPDPTNFPNSDSTVYAYGPGTLVSYANSYRNCRGRALKIQGLANISNEKIIRDQDYTNFGGSTEINLQYGVGSVRDCEFYYYDYLVSSTVTSPIQSVLTLVSFFQGSWYNEQSGGISVSGLKVYNAIKAGTGTNITAVLGIQTGAVPATKDRPLVELYDVVVNRGNVDWIAITSFDTGSYCIFRMDGIVIPVVTYSAIGSQVGNPTCEVIATSVVNLDAVKTPANAKPFVSTVSPAGGNLIWSGKLNGAMNRGWLQTYNYGSDFYSAPMLNGAALADQKGASGGAASVQSVYLANDASHTFDRRFFTNNRGLILVSVNYDFTTQGVMACGSDQIHVIAAHGSNLFSASTTGSNLDTAGKLNLWFTGGALNIKNRLGGTYAITVTFIG
jgi:hypothetical protein